MIFNNIFNKNTASKNVQNVKSDNIALTEPQVNETSASDVSAGDVSAVQPANDTMHNILANEIPVADTSAETPTSSTHINILANEIPATADSVPAEKPANGEDDTENKQEEDEQSPKTRVKDDTEHIIIDIRNISHTFNPNSDKPYTLFDNFSLQIKNEINQGQCTTLMGASGCGKSQILNLIAGISTLPVSVKDKVYIYGKRSAEYGNIPMVFQYYSNFYWDTVLDNVMMPLKLVRKLDDKRALEIATNLLNIVGLGDKLYEYPSRANMSGGQLQRVSIARCLATNSNIILFDEATSGLDIFMKQEIQNMILKIFYSTEYDPTIVTTSHDVDEAIYISNQIIILQKNPCRVFKVIKIQYPGESAENPRGEWVKTTPEFTQYHNEVANALKEAASNQ